VSSLTGARRRANALLMRLYGPWAMRRVERQHEYRWKGLTLAVCNVLGSSLSREAKGVKIYVNGQLIASVMDDSFANGGVGVRKHWTSASWDNVKIVAPK